MTRHLYLEDSYLKEFSSVVLKVNDGRVVLKESAFYPGGGGQPCDIGVIINGGKHIVTNVSRGEEGIVHAIEGYVAQGEEVKGIIDWERRYILMKMHTAAHLLSAVIHSKTGALITGNQLGVEQSRIDFSLEEFDRDKIQEHCEEANRLIAEGRMVKIYFTDSLNVPTLLAKGLPEGIEKIRVVEIENIDTQVPSAS